ncbi:hypothetical protein JX265_006604 [Neoarthrinium moseri]|uniref:Uncharacterized protein n=1 Tax=Neoarthrinium moseri TaxID=1658444 RepID=A0A9P9WLV1_9PEZI|nr:hypothetical protein JX265_006604 [Neoarthrinium moseri]
MVSIDDFRLLLKVISPSNLSMPGGLIKIAGAAAISIDKHGAFHLGGNEVQWDGRGRTTVEKPIPQE